MTYAYLYHNGRTFTATQVHEIQVLPDGSHKLTLPNKECVVAPGWMAYTVEKDKPGEPEGPGEGQDPPKPFRDFERRRLN